jgi:phosphoglycolate phosphatase
MVGCPAVTRQANAIRAAIVDLDGTLVDTLGDFSAALAATLEHLGFAALPVDVVAGFIGKGSEHLIRSALAEAGAPPEHYEAAWAEYQDVYRRINGRFSAVYPGVPETLSRLRTAGLRLACLTNKPTEFAQDLLARKGLALHFDHVFGGDAFERRKPDPLPVLRTCEALGCAPAETLVVGDSRNDADSAHAAGCRVVLVTYGYNHGEPARAVPAEGYADRFEQVAAYS